MEYSHILQTLIHISGSNVIFMALVVFILFSLGTSVSGMFEPRSLNHSKLQTIALTIVMFLVIGLPLVPSLTVSLFDNNADLPTQLSAIATPVIVGLGARSRLITMIPRNQE